MCVCVWKSTSHANFFLTVLFCLIFFKSCLKIVTSRVSYKMHILMMIVIKQIMKFLLLLLLLNLYCCCCSSSSGFNALICLYMNARMDGWTCRFHVFVQMFSCIFVYLVCFSLLKTFAWLDDDDDDGDLTQFWKLQINKMEKKDNKTQGRITFSLGNILQTTPTTNTRTLTWKPKTRFCARI